MWTASLTQTNSCITMKKPGRMKRLTFSRYVYNYSKKLTWKKVLILYPLASLPCVVPLLLLTMMLLSCSFLYLGNQPNENIRPAPPTRLSRCYVIHRQEKQAEQGHVPLLQCQHQWQPLPFPVQDLRGADRAPGRRRARFPQGLRGCTGAKAGDQDLPAHGKKD